jgi:hypothetical protein
LYFQRIRRHRLAAHGQQTAAKYFENFCGLWGVPFFNFQWPHKSKDDKELGDQPSLCFVVFRLGKISGEFLQLGEILPATQHPNKDGSRTGRLNVK